MKASSYSQNTESKGSLRGITLNIELSQKKKKKKKKTTTAAKYGIILKSYIEPPTKMK